MREDRVVYGPEWIGTSVGVHTFRCFRGVQRIGVNLGNGKLRKTNRGRSPKCCCNARTIECARPQCGH